MRKDLILERLTYWRGVYEKLQKAYIALIEGGAKNYMIDDRSVTKWDLNKIAALMDDAEEKIDEYEALLAGSGRRKSVGVIIRDW